MNLETIKNNIEGIINNKDISIDDKRDIIQNVIEVSNIGLSKLDTIENENVLESYLSKYRGSVIEDNTYTLEKSYALDRDFQEMFVEALYEIGIDGYGEYMRDSLGDNDCLSKEYEDFYDNYSGYENDVFYIRPYNWGGEYFDCNCGLDDIVDEKGLDRYSLGFHSKGCDAWETNFYYKPTGLKIVWYKYPLRSAVSNQELDEKTLRAIMYHCKKSVNS